MAMALALEARAARRARRRAGKTASFGRIHEVSRRLGLAAAAVSRLVIARVWRSPSGYSWPARLRDLRRRFTLSRVSRASEVAAARHGPPARAPLRRLRRR